MQLINCLVMFIDARSFNILAPERAISLLLRNWFIKVRPTSITILKSEDITFACREHGNTYYLIQLSHIMVRYEVLRAEYTSRYISVGVVTVLLSVCVPNRGAFWGKGRRFLSSQKCSPVAKVPFRCSVKIKNAWIYTSASAHSLHRMHRDLFTFYGNVCEEYGLLGRDAV
jgi:hypothetical protein